jgi:hypothetical protein
MLKSPLNQERYKILLMIYFLIYRNLLEFITVAIGDNGNILVFEIWWNFFYDLFSIKNVADVNSIDSFVSKRNMEEVSVVIMLSTPYRTGRELLWIKELGTTMPYGCNDNIKGVGNLSSPGCNEINVMSLFNTFPRTKHSHGHKRIQYPKILH